MAYSSNPLLPKARRWTINLVLKEGLSVSSAAQRAGVNRSTVYRWLRKAKDLELHGSSYIPTLSSRPRSHPAQLPQAVVDRIVQLRHELRRCAGYIHAVLRLEGITVSLASVGRVLSRKGLLYTWHGIQGKKRRARIPRPRVEAPGDLVQVDTVHFANWKTGERTYLYTLIDLKSRWVYAQASPVQNPHVSAAFVLEAQKRASFRFTTIQTDNGQEFSTKFERILNHNDIRQRRIRLGKKNDNAHIERFNRTIQDECLGRWPKPNTIPKKLDEYLDFYNNHRLHSGIQYRTPLSVLRRF